MDQMHYKSATELASLIRRKKVSALELLDQSSTPYMVQRRLRCIGSDPLGRISGSEPPADWVKLRRDSGT